MTINLKAETERLVREEIESGRFRSVDELIIEGVQALRAQKCAAGNRSQHYQSSAARLRELRKGVTLGGLRIKDLAHEGHHY
jgi:Arc/MetJ-type ribon-helix-helix transcriptional regulator